MKAKNQGRVLRGTATTSVLFLFVAIWATSESARAANLSVNCDHKETIRKALRLLATINPEGPSKISVSGSCKENVLIQSFDRLTLTTKNGASISDHSKGTLPVVDIEDSHSVTLQGFTINGGADGIDCEAASVCYLQANTIQSSLGQQGVGVGGGSRAFLNGNTIQNNTQRGLTVNGGAQVSSNSDTFSGNTSAAIVANSGVYLIATGSSILNNGSDGTGGDNWWKTSGQTGIFGPFPGEQDQTSAFGLSGTAQAPVAVGAAIKGSNAFGPAFHAFRWTPAGGLQDLGVTTGTESFATAISADGLVIVGEARDASGFWRAFRWTASTGMVDIGTLGGPESAAFAANKDGTVIVGASLTSGSTGSSHCFVWTAKTGMQDLKTGLQAAGVHTADQWVSLDTVDGISADGTVSVGYGLSPRTKAFPFGQWAPFRAVLPVP